MHAALTCGCKPPRSPGEAPAARQHAGSCCPPDIRPAPPSRQQDQPGHGRQAGHHQRQVASSSLSRPRAQAHHITAVQATGSSPPGCPKASQELSATWPAPAGGAGPPSRSSRPTGCCGALGPPEGATPLKASKAPAKGSAAACCWAGGGAAEPNKASMSSSVPAGKRITHLVLTKLLHWMCGQAALHRGLVGVKQLHLHFTGYTSRGGPGCASPRLPPHSALAAPSHAGGRCNQLACCIIGRGLLRRCSEAVCEGIPSKGGRPRPHGPLLGGAVPRGQGHQRIGRQPELHAAQ